MHAKKIVERRSTIRGGGKRYLGPMCVILMYERALLVGQKIIAHIGWTWGVTKLESFYMDKMILENKAGNGEDDKQDIRLEAGFGDIHKASGVKRKKELFLRRLR